MGLFPVHVVIQGDLFSSVDVNNKEKHSST